jgi:hypothetical protein
MKAAAWPRGLKNMKLVDVPHYAPTNKILPKCCLSVAVREPPLPILFRKRVMIACVSHIGRRSLQLSIAQLMMH